MLAQLLTVSIVVHPFILDKCYFWNSIDARTRFVSLKRRQITLRGPFSLQQRVDLMCISYALPVCIRMLLLIRVLLVCSRYVTCMLLVRIRVVRMYPHVTRICYPYVPAWCFSQDIWLAKKNLWIIFSNLSLYGIDLSGQSLQIVWHILKENSS